MAWTAPVRIIVGCTANLHMVAPRITHRVVGPDPRRPFPWGCRTADKRESRRRARRPRLPGIAPMSPPRSPMSRTYVIVGASTGLGRAAARALGRAAPSCRVIVAGRDTDRLRAAVPGAHAVLRVDLAELSDVERFARELSSHAPL